MSLGRKENMDNFPCYFDVLFRCNFDGQKIDLVSTYFFRPNVDRKKINVVSVYSLVQFTWRTNVTEHILMWF